MEGSFADELYSETLKLSIGESGASSSVNQNQTNLDGHQFDQLSLGDGSWCSSSPEEPNGLSDLERQWQRRRDEHYTNGYREGIGAGKEASAQEGFNMGYGESVRAGYSWGLVRGATSALACLPEGSRGKLVEAQEERDKFQSLYESAGRISTTDALKIFYDDMFGNESANQSNRVEIGVDSPTDEHSKHSLQYYYGELKSLVHKSNAIQLHLLAEDLD